MRLGLNTVTEELVAIKLVAKRKLQPSLHQQLEIVRRLNHKHIVKARTAPSSTQSDAVGETR